MHPILTVESLSKKFVIGHQHAAQYSSFRESIVQNVRGTVKKSLSLISQGKKNAEHASTEDFWALKDLNFTINTGDRVGIIGRNGAGKSTLLKILSRITEPTSGTIRIRGRVASLLEVGTGFHPELSGRENIFLNGAILGMSRNEIRRKFDEIVDFAEVEKFLDTPVKRYSSGMYVRLAFAVAAHLEPEILIVDEVLAVGDQQFQQKCLGKMQEVSTNEGRTVLFVSHNLPTVKSLCNSIIYLKKGQLVKQGEVEDTISEYLSENKKNAETGFIAPDTFRVGSGDALFTKVCTTDLEGNLVKEIPYNQPFKIVLELEAYKTAADTIVNIFIDNNLGDRIVFLSESASGIYSTHTFSEGIHRIEVLVNTKLLPLSYDLTVSLANSHDGSNLDFVENVYSFQVSRVGVRKGEDYPWHVVHGYVEAESQWQYS